jgi:hypothetical protein
MKPTSRHQLARFLDQIRATYPYGVPKRSIVALESGSPTALREGLPRFRFVIPGAESGLSAPERELLNGIITKGLRLSHGEYETEFAEDEGTLSSIIAKGALCTVAFGGALPKGLSEAADGAALLATWQLREILESPSNKREVWKQLQELIARLG